MGLFSFFCFGEFSLLLLLLFLYLFINSVPFFHEIFILTSFSQTTFRSQSVGPKFVTFDCLEFLHCREVVLFCSPHQYIDVIQQRPWLQLGVISNFLPKFMHFGHSSEPTFHCYRPFNFPPINENTQ